MDGVMAEAALKLRLPPLRTDTFDWRDMLVFLAEQEYWALGAGGAGENRALQDTEGGSVTQELQSPPFIL